MSDDESEDTNLDEYEEEKESETDSDEDDETKIIENLTKIHLISEVPCDDLSKYSNSSIMTKTEFMQLLGKRTKLLENGYMPTINLCSTDTQEITICVAQGKQRIKTNVNLEMVAELIDEFRSHYPEKIKKWWKECGHIFTEDVAKMELKKRQMPLSIIRSYRTNSTIFYLKVNPNECTNIEDLLGSTTTE